MTEKKAFYCFLGYLAGGALLFAGLVFCVDPFYHYHGSWFGIPVTLNNAVYQTPGAAEHLDFDSVIVGTSMTENFHASWFDEMGWKTVKLSYSGARSDDLRAILERLYKRKEPPAHIVMDLNTYQLTEPAWTAYVARPEYLYDDNPLTDVRYLYNYDVFLESLERITDRIQGRDSNLDNAYTWEDEAYFNRSAVLAEARGVKEKILTEGAREFDFSEMLSCCDENLENILPFIAEHPETEFYVFYPPYSMIYWEEEMLKGEAESLVKVFAYTIQRLMQYGNVKQYYFQDEWEIITNLDNYRDATHHRPEYNRYIYECIRDNVNLLTPENAQQRVGELYRQLSGYDYSSLWEP